MTMKDIQARYREICLILGDLTVKQESLKNQKQALFADLEKLDKAAEKIALEETDSED